MDNRSSNTPGANPTPKEAKPDLAAGRESAEKEEAEYLTRQIEKEKERERELVRYYFKLGGFLVIGLVFFVTCVIGILHGVSPKTLSFRAIVSTLLAAIFIYICQSVLRGVYSQWEKSETSEEHEA